MRQPNGKFRYNCSIIDLYDRSAVASLNSNYINTDLAINTQKIALKKENYSKGIIARDGETGLVLDLYVILGYGIKIDEILVEVQKKVKYVVETTLDVTVEAVNVYVQGLRNID